MPIGFLEAPFAGVFEKFIHRHEHYARPFHIQPQIEVEFIIEKMNVSRLMEANVLERAPGGKKPASRFVVLK